MARVVALRPGARGAPWYRQFWPWFVIALPASSVVFSVATLVVAVRHADSLVRDDYYQAGVAINDELSREHAAAARQVRAVLRADADRDELVVAVSGAIDPAEELVLTLSHPTLAARDTTFRWRAAANGQFRAPLAGPLRGPWNVSLEPADAAWRLAARLDFDAPEPQCLGTAGAPPPAPR